MCGIVGAFGIDVAPKTRGRALHLLAHRGPDSQGQHLDAQARVWLGHTRLAVLDLSPAGNQPMFSADGRVVIVFNGEVYNFRELRSVLEAEGMRFRSNSDTEVVLAQYLR